MRTLAIGDIHGGYKALVQVLERAEFNKEQDMLICLGDVADGWSETAECVEYLLSCKHLISIKGNHDEWFAEWLLEGRENAGWLIHGGEVSKRSYIESGKITDEAHKEFFKNQVYYYIDEHNRGFVHGGYKSEKGLGNDPDTVYNWERRMWITACSGHRSQEIPKLLRAHSEIFIGHTPTLSLGTDKPVNKCNVWNLDTGAAFNGKLTVMDVNTKEYWQSDKVMDLYPDEKGRN